MRDNSVMRRSQRLKQRPRYCHSFERAIVKNKFHLETGDLSETEGQQREKSAAGIGKTKKLLLPH